MKKTSIFALVLSIVFTIACKKDKKKGDISTESQIENIEITEIDKTNSEEVKKIVITLSPKSDSKVSGNVIFEQKGDTVSMIAVLNGLDEGIHAIHLHTEADCSSADGKSTGGHWNPTAQPHGKWGVAEGYHKGDIGNFTANAEGNGTITFTTSEWCIGCDDDTKNILGKAIIVHQGIDDFTSQPSGAAGTRVSCGGIIQ